MQSGYETAEIHQQQPFMADDCCPSSDFSISTPHKPNLHHLHYHNHYQQQQQQQHISITQQFFQHPHHFQAFQQQQQRRLHQNLCLGHDEGIDQTVGDCGTPTLPFFTVNFKLGLNGNNGNREGVLNAVEDEEEEEEENGLLRGNEEHIPQHRPNPLVMHRCWQPQEDSAIKEPLWKPLITDLFYRNNKRCNEGEKEEAPDGVRNMYSKISEQVNGKQHGNGLEQKYRHFGELEAIYGPTGIHEANQTGSGSALTAENSPTNAGLPMLFDIPHGGNAAAAGGSTAVIGVYHGSEETSIGEEASLRKTQKRKRKRKVRDPLGNSMAGFFERLVKQLMDHQENLHRKFLGVIGKMDQERIKRETAWRCEEAARYNCEANARAQEQALASCREAAIVSCLEKITGRKINLPTKETQLHFQPEIPMEPIKELIPTNTNNNGCDINANSRWPKAEVEALIQVRSSLESKFQEPGLKGPLWEEISTAMASMGYPRSAKRCKEKWENINKYFRKSKESAKKRSQISKTCPYFEQLDQLYSRSPLITGSSSTPAASYSSRPSSVVNDLGTQMKGNYSELLEAILSGNDLGISQNPSIENFKVAEMRRLILDFDGTTVDNKVEVQQGSHGKQKEYHGEEMDEDEDLDLEDNINEKEKLEEEVGGGSGEGE